MKKTGNLERCIREADQFLRVAIYCREENKKSPFALIYPLFVNAALACELYLKAIMIKESPDATFESGHDISDLFGKVNSNAQSCIQNNYKKKGIYISLNDLLLRYGNSFVDWRYSFENGSEGNYIGIIGFAESLKEYLSTVV